MFKVLFPSVKDATEVRDGENWRESDGRAISLRSYVSLIDYQQSDPRIEPWIHLKVDLDSAPDVFSLIIENSYAGEYKYHSKAVKIDQTAFSAVGLTYGVVCVSVKTDSHGAASGVFFNGHSVSSGVTDISRGLTSVSLSNLSVTKGLKIASVLRNSVAARDKPLRWYYVRNLKPVTQLEGEFEVDPAQVDQEFEHQDTFYVEFETDFEAREGSLYPCAYVEAYARHQRNSVQLGTASVVPTVGSKDVLKRGTWAAGDNALTLLDVGVDTMTNVGGYTSIADPEELKRIGFRADIVHVEYED